MKITDILDPRTIRTNLNVSDKAQALDSIVDILYEADVINDKEQFLKDVYVREAEGETGIGGYIAIPHGKSEAVVTPGVAVVTLDHEIEWESLDDTGARVVILFAVGTDAQAAEEHLRRLAMFSKRLGDEGVVNRLLDAKSAQDILDAFDEREAEEESLVEDEELDLDAIAIF